MTPTLDDLGALIYTLENENERLRARIAELEEELMIGDQAIGVSEWRRQECLRLAARVTELEAENRHYSGFAIQGLRPMKPTPDELKKRVDDFNALELPGQMPMMHMGTSYLVNDLYRRIAELEAEAERLRSALDFYAREIAYKGANQKNEGQDPFTSADAPYIQSIERDGGEIARRALKRIGP